jgi:hypothetical protein
MMSTRNGGRFSFGLALFATAALVVGAVAPASAASTDHGNAAEAKAAPSKTKRYCVEQVTTGTLLKQARVCKTRDEWIAQTGVDPAAKKH